LSNAALEREERRKKRESTNEEMRGKEGERRVLPHQEKKVQEDGRVKGEGQEGRNDHRFSLLFPAA